MNTIGEGNLAVLAFPKVSEMEQFISACQHKTIAIEEIVILRQRDFSVVARIELKNDPDTYIYKKVIAPWHIEADVIQFLRDTKLPNTVQMIGARKALDSAQLLQVDAGCISLQQLPTKELAFLTGLTLAQTHDAALDLEIKATIFHRYDSYERLQECFEENTFKLRALFPHLQSLAAQLKEAAASISSALSQGEFCLQHGDLFAENIVLQAGTTPVFIDWSYFSMIGPRLFDLATLTSMHSKNGILHNERQALIEGYAQGSAMSNSEIESLLPAAFRFSRLLFLKWLLTRVEMGITETTVGPVQHLIEQVVAEIIS